MTSTELLIDGARVTDTGASEVIVDAATGETITTVREAGPEQLEAAVRAAARAFGAWAETAPKDRAALLLAVADRITADAADYA